MFKTIIVGVDGSEHGQKAARAAGEMARLMQADLWLVIAYEPLPAYMGQPFQQQFISERTEHSRAIAQNARAEIGEVPGLLEEEILEGPAAEALLAVAETRHADLIVMGTRGLGRLGSLLIGSQSQKVAAQANCPVMLIR